MARTRQRQKQNRGKKLVGYDHLLNVQMEERAKKLLDRGETFVLLRLDPSCDKQDDDAYADCFEELMRVRTWCSQARVHTMVETCFRQQVLLWLTETTRSSRKDYDQRVARIEKTAGNSVAQKFLRATASTFWDGKPACPIWAF